MPTTPDDNATTWRDLADQLTDEQRATFEQLERETQGRAAATLLEFARRDIEGRLADMAYCDVPAPTGATWVGRWERDLERGDWSRGLIWREFGPVGDSDMKVDVDGGQQCDGTVERHISLYLDDDPKFTGTEARQLAAILVEAADELDRLQ